jgi:hypothetical protein
MARRALRLIQEIDDFPYGDEDAVIERTDPAGR